LADYKLKAAEIKYDGATYSIAHDDAQDHIFRQIESSGSFYEVELLEALRRYAPPGELVLDLGANIGNHSVFFAGVCGARVVAFEPHPRAFKLLQQNIEENSLSDRVDLQRVGVGERAAKAQIAVTVEHNLGCASVVDEGSDATTDEIDIVRLDDLDLHGPVRLIKIDIEGMEPEALRGARRIIERDRPVLCLEARNERDLNQISNELEGLDYQVIASLNFTPTHIMRPIEPTAYGETTLHLTSNLIAGLRFLRFQNGLETDRLVGFLRDLQRRHAQALSKADIEPLSQLISGLEEGQARLDQALRAALEGEAQGRDAVLAALEPVSQLLSGLEDGQGRLEASLRAALEGEAQGRDAVLAAFEPVSQQLSELGRGEGRIVEALARVADDEAQGRQALLEEIAGSAASIAGVNDSIASVRDQFISEINEQVGELRRTEEAVADSIVGIEGNLSSLDIDQAERFKQLAAKLKSSFKTQRAGFSREVAKLVDENERISKATGDVVKVNADRVRDQVRNWMAGKLSAYSTETNSQIASLSHQNEQRFNALSGEVEALQSVFLEQMAEMLAAQQVRLEQRIAGTVQTSGEGGLDQSQIEDQCSELSWIEALPSICFYRADLKDGWAGWKHEQATRLNPRGIALIQQARSTPGVRSGFIGAAGAGLYAVDVEVDFDPDAGPEPFFRVQAADGELLHCDVPLRPGRNRVRFFQAGRIDAVEIKVLTEHPFDGFEMRLGDVRLSRLDPNVHQRGVRAQVGQPVIASMASIPSRRAMLADAVGSLLTQCDEVRVFLNGYPDVPEFLDHPRVKVRRSQDFDDIGDAGKFGWVDEDDPPGYRVICDDDLLFPPDLIERLAGKVIETGDKAMVGLHGVMVRQPITQYYAPDARHAVHFQSRMDEPKLVQVLATCVMCVHSDQLRMRHADFLFRNMADVWLAKYAQEENIPLMIIDRRWKWVRQNTQPGGFETIYENSLKRTRSAFDSSYIQDAVLKSIEPFQVQKLDQPIHLCASVVRTREGLDRLTEEFGKTRARDADWIHVLVLASDDAQLRARARSMPFQFDFHIVSADPYEPEEVSRALLDLLTALDFDAGFLINESGSLLNGDWCTLPLESGWLERTGAVALQFNDEGELEPARLSLYAPWPDYAVFKKEALEAPPDRLRDFFDRIDASPTAQMACQALISSVARSGVEAAPLPAAGAASPKRGSRKARTVNELFERVAVLNLDRRPDRWEAAQAQLQAAGIQAERVRAVDGGWAEITEDYRSYAASPLRETGPAIPKLETMREFYLHPVGESQRCAFLEQTRGRKAIETPGAWGYLCSLINILEDAITDGVESVLVLDDDFRLHKDFRKEFTRTAAELPEDWLVFQLGTLQYDWDSRWVRWRGPRLYSQCGAAIGSHAVGLRREILPFLLERAKRMELPYDIGPLSAVTRLFPDQNFVAYPNLAIQGVTESDIGTSDFQRNESEVAQIYKTYRWDPRNYR